jgi:alkanesulfonate monooxygenase
MTARDRSSAPPVDLYATCPPSDGADGAAYRRKVAEVARWSEAAGCRGILIYADNRLVDPWLVAQLVVGATRELAPLVAVQPVYLHPYSVAKLVASFAHLHDRRVDLNLVSGGFRNDLLALGDETPHDARYARLVEYATIVRRLLEGGTVSFEGEHYRVRNLRLAPAPPARLASKLLVSGSSEAGRAAARALGAVPVKYPAPASEEGPADVEPGVAGGIRVGIVARATDAEAWRVARERFPGDRKGRLTHELAMKVSDSVWHHELSERAGREADSPYWLFPFENYKTMCPYLVGSYEVVGAELARYLGRGFGTLILDVPPDADELEHTREALAVSFERAEAS